MTKSILIFENLDKCIDLFNVFKEKSVLLSEAILVSPVEEKITPDQHELLNSTSNNYFRSDKIENIRILNPKLDRKIRQA